MARPFAPPDPTGLLAANPKRILAVSSGGGHWVQLNRLAPSLRGHDVAVVTVAPDYEETLKIPARRFYAVNDASRSSKRALVLQALRIVGIVLRERPQVVLTTGASAGYFAVRFGKLLGARTIWIDSIANAKVLSLSGRLAKKHADLWITQWPHLARPEGPHFVGTVF